MLMLQTPCNPWKQLAFSYLSASPNFATQPRTFFHMCPAGTLFLKTYNPCSAPFYPLLPPSFLPIRTYETYTIILECLSLCIMQF